jgi:CspA family cold shock protein
MICGRIKCFFQARGYGYIEDFQGQEVYFHYTSVEGVTLHDIVSGATVYFEAINTGLGLEAHRVQMLNTLTA